MTTQAQKERIWDLFLNTDMSIDDIGSNVGLSVTPVRAAIQEKAASLGIKKPKKTYTGTTFRRHVRKVLGIHGGVGLKSDTTPGPREAATTNSNQWEQNFPEPSKFDQRGQQLLGEVRDLQATLRKVASALRYLDSIKEQY